MKYLTERSETFFSSFETSRARAALLRRIARSATTSDSPPTARCTAPVAAREEGLIRRDWNQKRGVELVEQEAAKPSPAETAAP